jgi:microcystin-dependent protein
MNITFDFKHFLVIAISIIVLNYLITKRWEKFSTPEAVQNIKSLYNNENLTVNNAVFDNFKNIIVAWYGNIKNIPEGWVLCDGINGTPNLRDKFIAGAGNKYYPGDIGGKNKVKLKQEHLPSHKHSFKSDLKFQQNDNQVEVYDMDSEHHEPGNYHERYVKGTTDLIGGEKAHENRPPYHALVFIMFKG